MALVHGKAYEPVIRVVPATTCDYCGDAITEVDIRWENAVCRHCHGPAARDRLKTWCDDHIRGDWDYPDDRDDPATPDEIATDVWGDGSLEIDAEDGMVYHHSGKRYSRYLSDSEHAMLVLALIRARSMAG